MRRFTVVLLVLFALSFTASFLYAADADAVTVLKGARIIDGTGNPPIENGAVVIKGNQITAVGPAASVKVPKGAKVVDVSGRTIIPGLFSAHSHVGVIIKGTNRDDAYTRENVMAQLDQYEQYGVTSIVALGTNRDVVIDPIRAEQRAGKLGGTTIFSGDRGFGAPKGAPPLKLAADQVYRPTTPEEALKVVRETIARHPDILKIWVDDVFGQMTKMDPAIYKAIIEEAHKNKLKVAAHVFYLADAKALVAANLDVLAHSVRDLPVDQELISMMKAKGTWYIPTFTVDRIVLLHCRHPELAAEQLPRGRAYPGGQGHRECPELQGQHRCCRCHVQAALAQGMRNYKALHDAGIKLAFGTDSGANPPTRVPGFAEHHELELMVQAGIKPMEAIINRHPGQRSADRRQGSRHHRQRQARGPARAGGQPPG